MKLPDRFVTKYFQYGNDCSMYGVPIAEMGKEQLIACIGFFSRKERNTRTEHTRQLNFMKDIAKRM